MFQTDYILRQIEQLANVMAQILFKRRSMPHTAVLEFIEQTQLKLTGLPLDVVLASHIESLPAFFNGHNGVANALTTAHLLGQKLDIEPDLEPHTILSIMERIIILLHICTQTEAAKLNQLTGALIHAIKSNDHFPLLEAHVKMQFEEIKMEFNG